MVDGGWIVILLIIRNAAVRVLKVHVEDDELTGVAVGWSIGRALHRGQNNLHHHIKSKTKLLEILDCMISGLIYLYYYSYKNAAL